MALVQVLFCRTASIIFLNFMEGPDLLSLPSVHRHKYDYILKFQHFALMDGPTVEIIIPKNLISIKCAKDMLE